MNDVAAAVNAEVEKRVEAEKEVLADAIEIAEEREEEAQELAAEIAAAAVETERGKRVAACEEGIAACRGEIESLKTQIQNLLNKIQELTETMSKPQAALIVETPPSNPEQSGSNPQNTPPAETAPEVKAAVVIPAEVKDQNGDTKKADDTPAPAPKRNHWI